jgi:hypothetical protein
MTIYAPEPKVKKPLNTDTDGRLPLLIANREVDNNNEVSKDDVPDYRYLASNAQLQPLFQKQQQQKGSMLKIYCVVQLFDYLEKQMIYELKKENGCFNYLHLFNQLSNAFLKKTAFDFIYNSLKASYKLMLFLILCLSFDWTFLEERPLSVGSFLYYFSIYLYDYNDDESRKSFNNQRSNNQDLKDLSKSLQNGDEIDTFISSFEQDYVTKIHTNFSAFPGSSLNGGVSTYGFAMEKHGFERENSVTLNALPFNPLKNDCFVKHLHHQYEKDVLAIYKNENEDLKKTWIQPLGYKKMVTLLRDHVEEITDDCTKSDQPLNLQRQSPGLVLCFSHSSPIQTDYRPFLADIRIIAQSLIFPFGLLIFIEMWLRLNHISINTINHIVGLIKHTFFKDSSSSGYKKLKTYFDHVRPFLLEQQEKKNLSTPLFYSKLINVFKN